MKTHKEVLQAVKDGRESKCLDGRDYSRLSNFYSVDEWKHFGFSLKDGVEPDPPKRWTKKNILRQLNSDVDFGFEKALDCRGISSGIMYEVVKMWLWILEDDLQSLDSYAQYGLPLFKAVALKYEFENPIGDDSGSESKYQEH